MAAFTYGKLAPHSDVTHPRVKLANYLTETPAVPVTVDWASQVTSWPMYNNDKIGDCTAAALAHAVQAWTNYGEGSMVTLPYEAVLELYSGVSGYDPQTGANDHGAIEHDVLTYVQQHGIGGHKIRAFAQVDHKNLFEMKQALDIFGSLYVGFQVPQSAEIQFQAGQPWIPMLASPMMGGHAINIQKWDADYMYAVTWGRLQPMTVGFWMVYGDEAWVVLTEDWVNDQTGKTPTGLDLDGLLAEFDSMFGAPVLPPVPTGTRIMGWLKSRFCKS